MDFKLSVREFQTFLFKKIWKKGIVLGGAHHSYQKAMFNCHTVYGINSLNDGQVSIPLKGEIYYYTRCFKYSPFISFANKIAVSWIKPKSNSASSIILRKKEKSTCKYFFHIFKMYFRTLICKKCMFTLYPFFLTKFAIFLLSSKPISFFVSFYIQEVSESK